MLHLLSAPLDGLERIFSEARVVLLDVVTRIEEVALDGVCELVGVRPDIRRRVVRVLDDVEQLTVAYVRTRRAQGVLTRAQLKDTGVAVEGKVDDNAIARDERTLAREDGPPEVVRDVDVDLLRLLLPHLISPERRRLHSVALGERIGPGILFGFEDVVVRRLGDVIR